jgi:hypothetical protein
MMPTLGRIVHYTSKIDNGPGNEVTSAAMIILTRTDVKADVLDRWGTEPAEVGPSPVDGRTHTAAGRPDDFTPPESDTHVSLLVHGLGRDYREHNVAYDEHGGLGTWRWPALR